MTLLTGFSYLYNIFIFPYQYLLQWVSSEEVYLGGAAAVAVLFGGRTSVADWQNDIVRGRDERGGLSWCVLVSKEGILMITTNALRMAIKNQ